MGMGNYACGAHTIEVAFVQEIAMEEHTELMLAIAKAGTTIEALAEAFFTQQGDDLETFCNISAEQEEDIRDKWEKLYKAFYERTGGLELDLVHHEAEDRGDELDGWSFSVEGVFDYTPAGRKYKDRIEHKSWTVYG